MRQCIPNAHSGVTESNQEIESGGTTFTSRYLSREEAAQHLTVSLGLPVSKTTLQKWVTTGGGPIFRKFGKRAVYLVSDLEAWAQQKLSSPRASSTVSA